MKRKLQYYIMSVLCFAVMISFSAQAKVAEPDLKRREADYYIIEDATEKEPGEVSAKLQNREATIVIPEKLQIDDRDYIVTEITGLCYPDTIDASLKQDAYKCKKNKKTTKIVLPKTVTKIEKGAFTNFTKLKTIEIDSENTKYQCKAGSVLSKDGNTLYGMVTLKGTYRVPKGVKTIASRAFAYSPVKKVILSKECRSIKERAFYRCSKLKSIKNIKGVKKIGSGALYGTKLKNVTKDGKIKNN